jgi:hypothetical protein
MGSVAVTVGSGPTEVDFTNTAGGLGLLKICKVAGPGVTRGSRFSFTVGSTVSSATLVVPAGYCVENALLPVGTVVTVTEMLSPATLASEVSVLPADRQGSVNLEARTVTATVGVGVTEVYFTNVGR